VLRFGPYEVDVSLGELRKDGSRVPIQEKPLRLLVTLAENQGELVTRAELQKSLWLDGAFVDFENGLNTAVRKLRIALDDQSGVATYIETVPKRGYRFLVPVHAANGVSSGKAQRLEGAPAEALEVPGADAPPADVSNPTGPIELARSQSRRWRAALALAAAVILVAGGVTFWLTYGRPVLSFSSRDSVLVADFENQTGDPRFDQALKTAFTVSMEQSRHTNIFPGARLKEVLARMGKPPETRITAALGREICQRENIRGLVTLSITRTGEEYGIYAELIDPQSGDTVRSDTERAYGEGHILDALDVIASDVRRDLGESLYQIHRDDRPLPKVTTTSLDALKEYADGTAFWHSGRYDDAVTLFRAAIASDPDFAMAHAALGNADLSYIYHYSRDGDEEYRKALEQSSRTTERERMNIEASYADSQGHVVDADRLYQIFLKRYPDDWGMLSNYARFLRTHGRVNEAIDQYKEVLRVSPNDVRAQAELAISYKLLGRFPEAIDAYSKAFRSDPGYLTTGNVSREYGFALVEAGEPDKARALFNSLLANAHTRESGLRSLSLLDLYQGRYASAGPLLEQALVLDEGLKTEPLSVARIRLQLAILAEGEGDKREERSQLDSVMAGFKLLSPKVIVGAWVGSEYIRAGLLAQAEAVAASIVPLVDGKDPEQVAYSDVLQGEIALARGDKARAILLLGDADHENSTAYTVEGLARAYQQSGDIPHAIGQYEKFLAKPALALSWEPQQRWLAAHYTLALDYLAIGDRVKARAALNPLLLLWKDGDPNLPLRNQAIILSERLH
jgi:DNA-binding winged helix-turn-helix (wHTH) protein/tetratricopeptide (TPR) repeat protein